MKKIRSHQKLPTDWNERENLRNKGQFWTPTWVAEAMVEYVIKGSKLIFDPASGEGAFYNALKNLQPARNDITFYGIDIDEKVLNSEIYRDNFCKVELRDFIFNPPASKFSSIVANPPYIRHHRLSEKVKFKLKEICQCVLGFTIDGRAGLHVYFLIQALDLLEDEGKLAFIMPADTVEGIFSDKLWKWITEHFRLECVVTFSPEASPFPNVDTNTLVFFIKKAQPGTEVTWARIDKPHTEDFKEWVKTDFCLSKSVSFEVLRRNLNEALRTGLSRSPMNNCYASKLSDFAYVMRGIATGANDFFLLTRTCADDLKISEEFLKPAIARTRDVEGNCITQETLKKLERKGRPTLLFSPDGRNLNQFPSEVQKYLLYGESLGLSKKALIKTRNPWYKMEQRVIPKILFAYLGRRNTRFIKNEAGVLPLTGFLCIYPRLNEESFVADLWKCLNHPETIKNLSSVGKSYGSGAIKVEPRALEKLPLSLEHLFVNREGEQLLLFD